MANGHVKIDSIGMGKILIGDTFVKGVTSVKIDASCDEITQINLEMRLYSFEVEGEMIHNIMHPITGKIQKISSITFDDGEVFDFSNFGSQ